MEVENPNMPKSPPTRWQSTRANDIQVGGNHYASEYQHWDWAINVGMGYLESAATKYVLRWRKKNGKEDLGKARHYVQKLIEVAPVELIRRQYGRPYKEYIQIETDRFVHINKISDNEKDICYLLSEWENTDQLRTVMQIIDRMILILLQEEQLRGEVPVPTASPVPAEDSNKHADRA